VSGKVYIVTVGSYSEYHIEAIFSTEELADGYVDRWGKHYGASVEEWDLDAIDPFEHPDLDRYEVRMLRNGDTEWVHQEAGGREEDWIGAYWGGEQFLTVHCWARDGEHAVKIANERRAQAIAEGRFDQESKTPT